MRRQTIAGLKIPPLSVATPAPLGAKVGMEKASNEAHGKRALLHTFRVAAVMKD